MTLSSNWPEQISFALAVERRYAALMREQKSSIHQNAVILSDRSVAQGVEGSAVAFALPLTFSGVSALEGENGEPSLGGLLFYAGLLDDEGRALVVAANIAGATTMVATADATAQRRATRDGVIDFLVTSLDEALRILKNEIRKRETVAVCVTAAPERIEHEMLERGVLPDLLRLGVTSEADSQYSGGGSIVTWSVADSPALWLPKLDALALDCLASNPVARRWLRLAPRYLGRMAQNMRLLRCDEATAQMIHEQLHSFSPPPAVSIRIHNSFTP